MGENIELQDVEVIENSLDTVDTVPVELSEEEKQLIERKQRIQEIITAKNISKPKKHYGVKYKKERQKKNKQTKKSRRANRK